MRCVALVIELRAQVRARPRRDAVRRLEQAPRACRRSRHGLPLPARICVDAARAAGRNVSDFLKPFDLRQLVQVVVPARRRCRECRSPAACRGTCEPAPQIDHAALHARVERDELGVAIGQLRDALELGQHQRAHVADRLVVELVGLHAREPEVDRLALIVRRVRPHAARAEIHRARLAVDQLLVERRALVAGERVEEQAEQRALGRRSRSRVAGHASIIGPGFVVVAYG